MTAKCKTALENITSPADTEMSCQCGYRILVNKLYAGGPHDMPPVGAEAPCAAEQTAT